MITKLTGARIKELRSGLGMSQEAFANSIGMARTYFAEVETGKRNMSLRNLEKIASGLGVTLGEFFSSDLFEPTNANEQMWRIIVGGRTGRVVEFDTSHGTVPFPLVAAVAAGAPLPPVEALEEFPVPAELAETYPQAFLVRVSGDSMDRVLPDGAIALVEPCREIDTQDAVYAVSVDGADATLKRVVRGADNMQLVPESHNPIHQPIVFTPDQADGARLSVVGKVTFFAEPQ